MARFLAVFLLVAGFCLGFGQSRTLRSGDVIRVVCTEDPSLCVTRSLDFQGQVRLPLVGALSLVGLSPTEAEGLIADAAHLLKSEISVKLVSTRDRPISYYGAVASTGSIPSTGDVRLADVVKLAQPTVAADLDAVEIESETGEILTVEFSENGLRPEGNPYLKSGDRVVFPIATQSSQISILGGVGKPGILTFERGMTVKAAIDASGGVTNHGNSKDVRILRGGVEVQRFDLATNPTYALKRGDTVVVALSTDRRYVTVVGEVKNGGLIAWKQGMTLEEAIRDAGGFTPAGDPEGLRVQRIVGEERFRRRMLMSKDKAFVLQANDVIQVPLRGTTPPEPVPDTTPRRVVPPQ